MGMRQEQMIHIQHGLAIRLWLYISKPFQITKILEILYALDWVWFAALSIWANNYISSFPLVSLYQLITPLQISILFCSIAAIHIIGLWANIIILRKLCLLFNAIILCYFFIVLAADQPLPSSIGYFGILSFITLFAFLRMDEKN